jgi:hypothetical protein
MKKLRKEHPEKDKKLNIYDFVGIITEKEASEMKKVIAETCGQIDMAAWKTHADKNRKQIAQ